MHDFYFKRRKVGDKFWIFRMDQTDLKKWRNILCIMNRHTKIQFELIFCEKKYKRSINLYFISLHSSPQIFLHNRWNVEKWIYLSWEWIDAVCWIPTILQKNDYYKNAPTNTNISNRRYSLEVLKILEAQGIDKSFIEEYLKIFSTIKDFSQGPGSEKSPTKYGMYYLKNNEIIKKSYNHKGHKMNILIIQKNDRDVIGGVEKLNNILLSLFANENHNADLLSLAKIDCNKFNVNTKLQQKNTRYNDLLEKKQSLVIRAFALFWFTWISRNIVNNLKIDKYDIIIDSTYLYFKKMTQNKKYIWVQHNAPKFYKGYVSNNNFINLVFYIFSKLFLRIGNFFKIKNVVIFDASCQKYCKKCKNVFTIPIGLYLESEIIKIKNNIQFQKKCNVSYFGRIDKYQKNIKILINNKSNVIVDVHGGGRHEKILSKNNRIRFNGQYGMDELTNRLSNTKYMLLPSNYEGFPLAVVEALSHGVPALIKDSFPSAKFLAINNDFLAKDNADFIRKMNNLSSITEKEYAALVEACFLHSLSYLTLEAFYANWNNAINKIVKS